MKKIIHVNCPESKAYCPHCGRELDIYSFIWTDTGKKEMDDVTYKTCICRLTKQYSEIGDKIDP